MNIVERKIVEGFLNTTMNRYLNRKLQPSVTVTYVYASVFTCSDSVPLCIQLSVFQGHYGILFAAASGNIRTFCLLKFLHFIGCT